MKTLIRNILFLTLLFIGSCKKTIVEENGVEPASSFETTDYIGVPYPLNPSLNCQNAPNYGDTLIYPQPPPANDYFMQPKNNQGLAGTYFSWPAGLSMNPHTGTIDLTRSETGQRYSVAFVLNGSKDTCLTQLILAGASYIDSVYVLTVSNKTATPYFNANPYGPQPCSGPGCFFDWNGFALDQGIVVDMNTGFIDLASTMANNPFGISPVNGTTIFTTIYYALNDNSNHAHQEIDLELMYFDHKSDIPQNLLTEISANMANTYGDVLLSKGPKPRPPLLIIVRQN
jgi:hypothetical protein